MGSDRRGYVTFLLALLWSYLLLLPFLIPSSPTSLAPAYSAERAWREEISFKRALAYSTIDTYRLLNQNGDFTRSFGKKYSPSFPTLPSSSSPAFNAIPEAEELYRTAIVWRWREIASGWSSGSISSEFSASISCMPLSPASAQSLANILIAPTPPICAPTLAPSGLSFCCYLMNLGPAGLQMLPELRVTLVHPSGFNATGETRSGDVIS